MLGFNKFKEEVAEVKQQEQKKESKFLGTMKPHKGHTMFSVNKKTLQIKEAELIQPDYTFGQPKPNKKINVEADCLYVPALNIKNLYKKLKKQFPNQIEEIIKVNSK